VSRRPRALLQAVHTFLLAVTLCLSAKAQGLTVQTRAADGSESGPGLALTSEQIDVDITGQAARTELKQAYVNRGQVALQATFSLSLVDDARVVGFDYRNGETLVKGEVFERSTAEEVYRETTGLGRDPGLATERGEGTFDFNVFPIAPNERKPVHVSVEQWLTVHGGEVRYRFPLSTASAAVHVRLSDSRPLSGFASPTHELAVERDGAHWVIEARPRAAQAMDFVLTWHLETPAWEPYVETFRSEGMPGYVVVALAAPQTTAAPLAPRDVTLLLDHSGSMGGAPLQHARTAALALLGQLREQDRLNLIAFDDRIDLLFDSPQPLSRENREKARRFITDLSDGGGTDIAAALSKALSSQRGGQRDRIVLLLTDGQSNGPEAIAAASSGDVAARVFTVGLGDGVDRPVLEQIARSRHGTFTFVPDASTLTTQLAHVYASLAPPVLSDVKLTFTGHDAHADLVYPANVDVLPQDGELRFLARTHGSGPLELSISARELAQPLRRTLQLETAEAHPWVGRLWATERIADLLGQNATHGEDGERVTEITNLGILYDLVTPYTAFLAIPQGEVTEGVEGRLADARARKAALLAAHPDAARLSRSQMPPGDPVLTVRAPKSARSVTAVFPFGLTRDLLWDERLEQWTTRFLVPNDVADGTYWVEVWIVDSFGRIARTEVPFTIDSLAPGLRAHFTERGDRLLVEIEGDTELSEARLWFEDTSRPLVVLEARPAALHLRGELTLTGLSLPTTLRVVGTDAARNEAELSFTLSRDAQGTLQVSQLPVEARP